MRMGRVFPLFGLLVVALTACAAGQEPILDLSISPGTVHIPPGGEAELRLIAKNTSIREADGLSASLSSPDRFTIVTGPETLEIIDPFATGSIDILLKSGRDIGEGNYKGKLAIVYTYCIGELCFQIADTLDFDIVVEAGSEAVQTRSVTAPIGRRTLPWPWIGFGGGLVILGAALLRAKRTGVKWHAYLIIALLSLAGLGYGVANDQHEQAQEIGAVLCTSCVGLEEASSGEGSLSAAGIERIKGIENKRELIVFYVALRHGLIRSGKTIVPAVLRVDTGKVIFGIEDFEERLIDMLEEGE